MHGSHAGHVMRGKKWDPFLDPLYGSQIRSKTVFVQALACWQWWNALLRATVKIPLRINLDETAICVEQVSLFAG